MPSEIAQYLSVDKIHELYYEVHGNPQGETVLFLHGGPGAGVTKADFDFFDLEKIHLILFDQRGCGKSYPKGELRNNTTQDLVEDMNQLLIHLNKTQVFLFGGSWGSTLSLLFGIKYPNKVKGMILRGFFMATKEERRPFEQGETKSKFPQVWSRFERLVPLAYRSNISNYYFDKILNGEKTIQEKMAHELIYYGYCLSSQEAPKEPKLAPGNYVANAKILSHYSINDFFMPDKHIENNLPAISQIPIRIIQGLNDQITLPYFAKRFAKKMTNVKLTLVNGGHSPRDKNVKAALIKTVQEFVK